jgi:hypothetical protein
VLESGIPFSHVKKTVFANVDSVKHVLEDTKLGEAHLLV